MCGVPRCRAYYPDSAPYMMNTAEALSVRDRFSAGSLFGVKGGGSQGEKIFWRLTVPQLFNAMGLNRSCAASSLAIYTSIHPVGGAQLKCVYDLIYPSLLCAYLL